MTLEWIIERLKLNGKGTKREVLHALENATEHDLDELERSITSYRVDRMLKNHKEKGNVND